MADRKEAECCGRVLAHTVAGKPYAHTCEPQGQWHEPAKGACICVPDSEEQSGGLREDCPTHGAFEREEMTHTWEDPAQPDPTKGPWFTAGYDSECSTCDGAIFAGDEIRANGYGGYECRENCGEEEPHPDESPKGPDHVHSFTWGDDGNGHEGSYCTGCGEAEPPGEYAKRVTDRALRPVPDDAGFCSAADGYAVHSFSWDTTTEMSRCVGCGDADTAALKAQRTLTEQAIEALDRRSPEQKAETAARMDAVASDALGLPRDDFMDPDEPEPEKPRFNVSGQPEPRYETRGGQKIGYSCKDPRTGEFRTYKNGNPKGWTRATTFNKAATDQNNLTGWKQRNVLIGAALHPELVERAAGLTHEDDKRELMQLVGQLETAAGAKISADVGTEIHELTERWDGGQLSLQDAAAHQYADVLRLYQKALNEYGLRPVPGLIERTVFCDLFGGVVGTFDRVYLHEPSGQYVIGDVKTGKTLEYGMDEIETQEWIYAYGINKYGVYDWNEDEWEPPEMAVQGHHGATSDRLTVSEEWGVVIHLPVQGEQAGTCTVVGADLQRGKRYAKVCHQVRETRKAKPKPKPFDPSVLMPTPIPWESYFSTVTTKEEASSYWQQARAEGVDRMELQRLVGLAQQRLRERGISA